MRQVIRRGLLLFCALALGCSSKAQSAAKQRPVPTVVVAPVTVRDVPIEVQAPVDLRPIEQVEVVSKVLGYVEAVLVDRGDVVKRGQLLALVRPSDLPSQMAAARSSYAQTEASLAMARANYERAKSLAPSGIVSQQELDQAATALASAQAVQSAAQAQVGALGVKLDETRITSPMSGIIAQRRLDPGALVGPGVLAGAGGSGGILTVVRIDRLRVFLAVGERYAARVRVGLTAHVTLDALPDQVVAGLVTRVSPQLDSTTRTLEVEVQMDNPGEKLRPGMYGRGAIELERHSGAIVVPVGAVRYSSGRTSVFTVEGDKARLKPVQVGVDGEQWLEITSGLSPTDSVVIAGADVLADGATVKAVAGVEPFLGTKTAPQAGAPATGTGPNPQPVATATAAGQGAGR